MRCYLVTKDDGGEVHARITHCQTADLPEGDVLVRVAFTSLNYKDALAATGHPGVIRHFPHVPGIDAAGHVVQSRSERVAAGDEVIVTGYELGAGRWGGWAQYIQVPAEWIVPLPSGISLHQAMSYGTAGLTAALCVDTLQQHEIMPEMGQIVVTGASGGVGSLAVSLLAQLGYTVVAVSGKPEAWQLLKTWGAAEVVGRDAVNDLSNKPLLPARWAGAVDTVGGNVLRTLLSSTQLGGCVTACGLVGGSDLPLTVYPLLLRGVTLSGIASALCPYPRRIMLWQKLAGPWKLDHLDAITKTIALDQLEDHVRQILAGGITGRTVVEI
jgi:putative YhdH/YhfP family quinone oxidoreductase